MIGSFCWFTAFTLQNAAYVNALGQIELIFSLAASALFFRERIAARELAGMALLGLGITGADRPALKTSQPDLWFRNIPAGGSRPTGNRLQWGMGARKSR